ncbi:MAG: methyl-accepting chemotaxis protein [Solirubrobacterales bacterium]
MKRWMQSVPLKRAYTISTLGYTLPLLAIGIVLALVGQGAVSASDQVLAQSQQAAKGDVVTTANVTAEPQFTDVSKEYALLVLLAALLGGAATKAMLTNVLMRETYVLVEATRTAAGGDLRPEIEVNMTNEYGMLQASIRDLFGAFRTTISRIETAALEMRDAANEMTHTSDESGRAINEVAGAVGAISEGAAHQSGLITDVSDVMVDIERTINDASEYASEAQRQSADTEKLAEHGVEAASEVLAAMQVVREESISTAVVIRELGEKSSSIDQIVAAIGDIAQQTNMLALNAAIEAARAGEAGRGFGNVAGEVRALADDAQSSADQITRLVAQIQQQTGAAVHAMEEAVVAVEAGFETINSNRQTFFDISSAVHSLHEGAAEVSELAAGIALGAGQVREQIEEVAAVAQQSSASTEQVSAATEETSADAQDVSDAAQRVSQTAYNLAELAGRFELPTGFANRTPRNGD